MKEQLYSYPMTARQIAESAINLYREYFDRLAPDFDPEQREELEDAAMRAAVSDTLEGVEADVSVPEDEEIKTAKEAALKATVSELLNRQNELRVKVEELIKSGNQTNPL